MLCEVQLIKEVNDFHQNLQAVHFSINYNGVGVYVTLNQTYHESYRLPLRCPLRSADVDQA